MTSQSAAYARWLLSELARLRYGHIGTVRRTLVALGYLPAAEGGRG